MRSLEMAWELGGIMHDRFRAVRIAAKHDWHRLMTPELEQARMLYDKYFAPDKPCSPLVGYTAEGMYSVSLEQLLAVWRERRHA